MACKNCGLCCQAIIQKAPSDSQAEDLMRRFGLGVRPLDETHSEILIPGPCRYYDPEPGHHCTDYGDRPQKCRDFLCGAAKEDAA
jgi:Fe-S-cluster containining protein